jgi:hypothetical protein
MTKTTIKTFDLTDYIDKFERMAKESLDQGKIDVVFLWSDTDPASLKQFEYFNSIHDDFVKRILPVLISSKLGKHFVEESWMLAEKCHDPAVKIEFTPTFLDFKTHEKIAEGLCRRRAILKGRRRFFRR